MNLYIFNIITLAPNIIKTVDYKIKTNFNQRFQTNRFREPNSTIFFLIGGMGSGKQDRTIGKSLGPTNAKKHK